MSEHRIATGDVHPVEREMSPTELAEGWREGIKVNDVGCTQTVLVDDCFTKAIRVSVPDGMPGPDAYRDWKATPMTVHVYEFPHGNEMEAQMAFDRWVVEYTHDNIRRECG